MPSGNNKEAHSFGDSKRGAVAPLFIVNALICVNGYGDCKNNNAAMAFLQPYVSLPGYLKRFTIVSFWKFHVRIHDISADDATPFLHSHPFNYLSVVLRGGYTEQHESGERTHRRFSIILHSNKFFHRIVDVKEGTKTLFVTWGKYDWGLKKATIDAPQDAWIEYAPGVYQRTLSGKTSFAKFDTYWFRSSDSPISAMMETRPSINQTEPGVLFMELSS